MAIRGRRQLGCEWLSWGLVLSCCSALGCSSGLEEIDFVQEVQLDDTAADDSAEEDPLAAIGRDGGSELDDSDPMGSDAAPPPVQVVETMTLDADAGADAASSMDGGAVQCPQNIVEVHWDPVVSRALMPMGHTVTLRLSQEFPAYAGEGQQLLTNPTNDAPTISWLIVFSRLSSDVRLEMEALTDEPETVETKVYPFSIIISDKDTKCHVGTVDVTLKVTE